MLNNEYSTLNSTRNRLYEQKAVEQLKANLAKTRQIQQQIQKETDNMRQNTQQLKAIERTSLRCKKSLSGESSIHLSRVKSLRKKTRMDIKLENVAKILSTLRTKRRQLREEIRGELKSRRLFQEKIWVQLNRNQKLIESTNALVFSSLDIYEEE